MHLEKIQKVAGPLDNLMINLRISKNYLYFYVLQILFVCGLIISLFSSMAELFMLFEICSALLLSV